MAVSEDLRAERRLVLQGLLEVCGFDLPSGLALNGLLTKCPDVDLAFTALTMDPRPAWVQEIVGPESIARSTQGLSPTRPSPCGSGQRVGFPGSATGAMEEDQTQAEKESPPEDVPGEPGAEGGSDSPAADKLPGAPASDDAPIGDTDQHSTEAGGD